MKSPTHNKAAEAALASQQQAARALRGASRVQAEYKAVSASIQKIRAQHQQIEQALAQLQADKAWWK